MTGQRVGVLGLDPGPAPGVVVLELADGKVSGLLVVPAPPENVPELIRTRLGGLVDLVALEKFLVSPGTARRTRGGSELAMSQAVTWKQLAKSQGLPVQYLPAGTVKPWATDTKLKALGLYQPTAVGGGHHRDACRHALYMAARRGLLDLAQVLPPGV